METSSNIFKQINSDFDSIVEEQTSVMVDNAMISKDSYQRYTVTPYKGNSLKFAVTAGFKPIAVATVEDIVFVLSVNGSTAELGSYPSPKVGGGMEEVYRPFQNFSGSDFRTTLFNIVDSAGIEDRVSIIATASYDTSYDILIMDGINPNRMINCGFTRLGVRTSRGYIPEDFDSIINQQLSPSRRASIDVRNGAVTISPGGSLKVGNYFIFIRLLDESYNKTPFLFSGGPVAVFNGEYDNACSIISSSKMDDRSDKMMVINISNLDTTYTYFEVALFRYFSTPETLSHDAWLLPTRYEITNGSSTVNVYGNETTSTVTDAELMKTMPLLNACEHGVINNSRFFGVNWSGKNRDNVKEQTLIGKIKPIPHFNMNNTKGKVKPQYNRSVDANYVSYMPGEIYMFCGVIEYKDGTTSQPYAVQGCDALNYTVNSVGTDGLTYNDSGLVRFPDFFNFFKTGDTGETMFRNMLYPLGVKFDFTELSTYLASLGSEFSDVVGIRIMRSDRVENLLYTGFGLECTNALVMTSISTVGNQNCDFERKYTSCASSNFTGFTYIGFTKIDSLSGAINYPHYSDLVPSFRYNNDNADGSALGAIRRWRNPAEQPINTTPPNTRNYAIFSPDFMFSKKNCPATGYITKLATFEMKGANTTETSTPTLFPQSDDDPMYIYDAFPTKFASVVYSNQTPRSFFAVNLTNVEENNSAGINGFISTIRDINLLGKDVSKVPFSGRLAGFEQDIFYALRSNRTKRYIGINYSPINIEKSLVAVYRQPNNADFYNNIVNSMRNQMMTVSIVATIPYSSGMGLSIEFYNGDCFCQDTSFLVNKTFEESPDSVKSPEYYLGKTYSIGTLLNIRTYNTLNSNMRNIGDGKIFYPYATNKGYDYKSYIASKDESVCFESVVLNAGNSKTLHPQIMAVSVKNKPYKPMRESNLVVPSEKYLAASYESGLRKLDFTNSKTYFTELGPIKGVAVKNNTIIFGHTNGVSMIQSEQQIQQQGQVGSPLLLGVGPILPEMGESYSTYGISSHRRLLVDDGIYGIDFVRKAIWTMDENGQVNLLKHIGMDTFGQSLFTGSTLGFVSKLKTRKNNGVIFYVNGKVMLLTDIEGKKQITAIGSYSPILSVPYRDVMLTSNATGFYEELSVNTPIFYGVKGQSWFEFYVTAPNVSRQAPKLYEVINLQGKPVYPIRFELSKDDGIIYNFVRASLPFWYGMEYEEEFLSIPIPNMEDAEGVVVPANQVGLIGTEFRGTFLRARIVYDVDDEYAVRSALTAFNISTI